MRWPWVSRKRFEAAQERVDDLMAVNRAHHNQNKELRAMLRAETAMHQNERHDLFEAAKAVVDAFDGMVTDHRQFQVRADLTTGIKDLRSLIYFGPDVMLDTDPSKPEPKLHPQPVAHIEMGDNGVPVLSYTPSPLSEDGWEGGATPPAAAPATKVHKALLDPPEDEENEYRPGGIDNA